MAVNPLSNAAFKAYGQALDIQKKKSGNAGFGLPKTEAPERSFSDTLKTSLKKVNELQEEKSSMIESFAAGQNQNVHELMISLQKAGLAMSMTSAVRNKVMTAYQEIMKMPM